MKITKLVRYLIPLVMLVVMLVTSKALFGCTPLKPYRLGDKAVKSVPVDNVDQDYRLAFVEFDDQGELWDRDQLRRVKEDLLQTTKDSPHLVVVFAHGWLNDASEESEQERTLSHYKQALAVLSQYMERSKRDPGRKVYGVFLSWRGASTYRPVLDYLSFYNRRAAAARIGTGSSITEVIAELGATANANKENRSILIGHSFGCILVENAVHQLMAARSVLSKEKQLMYDRVFLLNGAQRAIVSKQLIDTFREHAMDNNQPPLISITSVADDATGRAFPIGQSLIRPFNRLRNEENYDLSGEYAHGQEEPFMHTTGHTPSLFSHTLERIGEGGAATDSAEDIVTMMLANEEKSAQLRTLEQATYLTPVGRYRLNEIEDSYNNTPYWVFQAPEELIPDHGNVFEPSFLILLSALAELDK